MSNFSTRGSQFIESLNDGRRVWLSGEEVIDVARHKAFEGTVRTISELYDTLDDPNDRDIVGFPSPITSRYVHQSYLVPTTHADLLRRRQAFELWAKRTYGVMSRLSESGRSYITGFYAAREQFRRYDPSFPAKIERYFEHARDNDRFVISVVLDPPIDRAASQRDADPDAVLRIVRQSQEGVVIRGAKVMATAGPYAHDIIVMPNHKRDPSLPGYANMMIVPLNASGVHIVCRESFAIDRPDSHPLGYRFDEMDATVIFDDVLVPWERVLLHETPDGVWQANIHQRDNSLTNHQIVIRLAAKLEFIAGVCCLIADANGSAQYLHVQEKLGELFIQIETIKALIITSEAQASTDAFGTLYPDPLPLRTARNLGGRYYPRAIEIVQQIGASELLQAHSGAASDARSLLFKLAWDLVGSPLGARLELYERFFSGDSVRSYAAQYESYNRTALTGRVKDLLQQNRVPNSIPH